MIYIIYSKSASIVCIVNSSRLDHFSQYERGPHLIMLMHFLHSIIISEIILFSGCCRSFIPDIFSRTPIKFRAGRPLLLWWVVDVKMVRKCQHPKWRTGNLPPAVGAMEVPPYHFYAWQFMEYKLWKHINMVHYTWYRLEVYGQFYLYWTFVTPSLIPNSKHIHHLEVVSILNMFM